MIGDKMKYILLTVVLVLVAFCGSGDGIRCYKCSATPGLCKEETECSSPFDACLKYSFGGQSISDCWKYSQCSRDFISNHFKHDNFKFGCCQRNLCNKGPSTVVSKAVLSIVTMLTVVWMLCL
uniref:CD59 glycoprotein n=1 Tax=Sphenodon punctatus TaxID=8508 RepID=A0A8D0H001_SPHPU